MLRSYKCVFLCLSLLISGCSSVMPLQENVAPVIGPAPRLNTTPMADALSCIASQVRRGPRIGVADFVDGTGVMEGGTQNSRALSQRPDMMMTVALATSGAQLVNRSSVNVVEWEMNKAMEKKLGDGRASRMNQQKVDFRPIKAGILLGSTHYIMGAITELNWNISSNVAEGGAFSVAAGRRTYRISIAVDVVVTNTQTTEIVHARSYKKQLVGFETNANYFRFMNHDSATKLFASGNAAAVTAVSALELFQANLGEKQSEPTQTALRWVIELAAYDIMRNLTGGGQSCDQLLLPSIEAETQVDRIIATSMAPSAPSRVAVRVAELPKAHDGLQEPSQTAADSVPGEFVASVESPPEQQSGLDVGVVAASKPAEAGQDSFGMNIGGVPSALFASPETPPPPKAAIAEAQTPKPADAQQELLDIIIERFMSDLFVSPETASVRQTDNMGEGAKVKEEQQVTASIAARKISVAPAIAYKVQAKRSLSSSAEAYRKARLTDTSRKVSKVYKQRKATPSHALSSIHQSMKNKSRPDLFDAAELGALISWESDRSRPMKATQAAPAIMQASNSGVLEPSANPQAARGWMPGSLPTPNPDLLPNIWKGER